MQSRCACRPASAVCRTAYLATTLIDMGEAATLREALEHTRDRLHHVRERGAGVVAMPSPAELATLELDGYLGTAIDALRAAAELPEGAEPTGESRSAARALDLFYRLYHEGAK